MFGGNWDWSVLNQYEPSKNMGMMPVPQNDESMDVTSKLVSGGSKYLFIDNSKNTSKEQQEGCKGLPQLARSRQGRPEVGCKHC